MAAACAPPTASAPAAGGSDLITDDEFEALLDQLHGGNAPTAVAPAKADDGLISEDEFEALLDQLHGGAAAPSQRSGALEPPAPGPHRHRQPSRPPSRWPRPNTPCAWTPSAWTRSST
jgi:two-component system chemotaxis sensor kinase CheA